MPTLQSILSVALAGLALSATPGPSMLYVLSRTVAQGRLAGYASALGLCLGGVVLAIATAFGLAKIFESLAWLEVALLYLGAGYLTWLGIGMIREARPNAQTDLAVAEVAAKPLLLIMWQGIMVELLNPKTVLFFALFLPPFVAFEKGASGEADITLQLLILGCLVPLTAVPSDLLVASVGGAMTNTLNRSRRAREVLAWVGGLTLIVIAASLLLETFAAG